MTTTSTRRVGRRPRRTAIVAAAAAVALLAAACSGSSDSSSAATTAASTAPATAAPTTAPPTTAPAATATTVPPTTAPAATGPAGLKPIDRAAVQAIADAMVQESLVPGLVVQLRTPQGDFTAAAGTTELGAQTVPDADTHFRIASITKTMTAAVILQLAQEGKLKLDDPVSKYVPEVPNGDNITVAQLLEMRSGLYSFTDSPEISASMDDDPTRVWTPQELLAIAYAQPPMFAPGAEYYYSNTNYVLLGLIIEQLDGKSLADSFEDRLFEPLGMTNTSFPAATSTAIPEPYSHGYLYGSAAHVMVPDTPPYTPEMEAEARAGTLQPTDFTDINPSFGGAAGAAISTAADLATWMKALAGGKVFNADYQRIWQDSAKIIDPKNSYNWYGYGIDQLRWGPNTVDLHGGQTPGFNSEAAYDPANDMTLVVWTNLTMSLDNKFTAQEVMVQMLDQIYALSPLPPASTTGSA